MRRSLTITIIALLLLASGCGDGERAVRSGGVDAPVANNQDNPEEDVIPPHEEQPDEDASPHTHGEPAKGPPAIAPQPPPPPSGGPPGSAERPAQGVFGKVSTQSGQPIAGAMVQPAPGRDNPAPESEVFATTAADGTYGIGLSPGQWNLTISADGFEPKQLSVTVPQGGTVHADAALPRAG